MKTTKENKSVKIIDSFTKKKAIEFAIWRSKCPKEFEHQVKEDFDQWINYNLNQ